MNKCYLIIIILLSLFCFDVYAKDVCDLKQIKIEDVSVKEKSDNTIEVSNAEFKDNKLSVDLKMFDVGDFIEYKIKLKNTSTDDFYFDSNLLNIDSNYFDYSISYQDNSNKIESNKEKNVFIKIKYKKEVEKEKFYGAKFIDNRNVILNISNKNIFFTNPLTGSNNILIIIIVYLIIIGTLLYFFKFKKSKISLFVIIGLTILLPMHAIADCKYSIDIDSNVVVGKVKPHPCYFDGELVPGAEFRDGDFIYRYKQEYNENEAEEDWELKWRDIEEDGWGVIHKQINSGEVNTDYTPILCSTINDKPLVSMSYTFYEMYKLPRIDVSNIDTSNVVNMSHTFEGLGSSLGFYSDNRETVEIVGLDNWDTHRVKNMYGLFFAFGRSAHTINIYDLSQWDVSNVEDMRWMFYLSAQGTESENPGADYKTDSDLYFGDISNWDVSKVKDMSFMFSFFGACSKKLELDLSKWDVSNVESFEGMFESTGSNAGILTLKGLHHWDVSKAKNMSDMFWGYGDYTKRAEIGDISNWDVSNVEDMSYMFGCYGSNAQEIVFFDLSNWNTKKVKNMNWMFDRFAFNSETTINIGTLNVYADEIKGMFPSSKNVKATLNIYSNPIYYENRYGSKNDVPFENTATTPNSLITVNYSKNTTNIDDIIATKSENSNVVKGKLLD